MVLTAAQVNAFFTHQDQMAIPVATVNQLAEEGIETIQDLAEFNKDTFAQVLENLRKPGGRIPNPDPNAPQGSTIPQPPFTFGAKSHRRILAACDLIRYYDTIGRDITPQNVRWNPIIKNFEEQWKALTDRRVNDDPEVPKISKSLPIIKWVEAFRDYCHRKVGMRTIPRAYIIRDNVNVPADAPALAPNLPHSVAHGSVEGDLIARASHNHPLYRDDNAHVYYDIELAVRGTAYAATIRPFQRNKDGRSAFLSLCNQHAGNDKWQAELKKSEDVLHNRVWKGQGSFPLEKFVGQHRNAYIMMHECSTHVEFQLPNERTRVTYLLDAIQCGDAPLQAAMALVRNDTGEEGKMNNFEATASFILPHCPVAKRKQSTKRGFASISDVTGDTNADVSATSGIRNGIGKTGVELRFYKKKEYDALTREQKEELREYRLKRNEKKSSNEPESSKKKLKKEAKSQKKMIAAAVKEEMQKQQSTTQDKDEEFDFESYVKSVVASAVKGTKTASTSSTTANKSSKITFETPPKSTLNSILRRALKKD